MKNQDHIVSLIGKNNLEEAIREIKLNSENNSQLELIQVEGQLVEPLESKR